MKKLATILVLAAVLLLPATAQSRIPPVGFSDGGDRASCLCDHPTVTNACMWPPPAP